MKKIAYIFLVLQALLWMSCGNGSLTPEEEKQNLTEKISKQEGKLKEADGNVIIPRDAHDMLSLYHEFSEKFPNEKITPDYLFKAGQIAMSIGNYQKSIDYFDRIRKNYPDFDKSPESLFIIGFIYDSYLFKKGMAKEIYEEVIEKYPDHKFAEDAKASINLLTMTDEELIEMFKQKEAKLDSIEGL